MFKQIFAVGLTASLAACATPSPFASKDAQVEDFVDTASIVYSLRCAIRRAALSLNEDYKSSIFRRVEFTLGLNVKTASAPNRNISPTFVIPVGGVGVTLGGTYGQANSAIREQKLTINDASVLPLACTAEDISDAGLQPIANDLGLAEWFRAMADTEKRNGVKRSKLALASFEATFVVDQSRSASFKAERVENASPKESYTFLTAPSGGTDITHKITVSVTPLAPAQRAAPAIVTEKRSNFVIESQIDNGS